jgi:hypothetical protein
VQLTHLSPEADEKREGSEQSRVVEVEDNVRPFDRDEAEEGIVDGSTTGGHYDGSKETLVEGHSEGFPQPRALLLIVLKGVIDHHQNLRGEVNIM